MLHAEDKPKLDLEDKMRFGGKEGALEEKEQAKGVELNHPGTGGDSRFGKNEMPWLFLTLTY